MTAEIGSYTVAKKIGEGGFGRVFQGEHKILKTPACLKQNIYLSESDALLLQHEARLLWKLDEYHSIPSIKEFYRINRESSVIVLSYIDGNTLEEIVQKNGALHPEDSCWIAERLLSALYYAHSNGIIHTDVKPENVFVEPEKRDIKLIDWGLATYKPTSSTKPLGYSPKYAAPELKNGDPPLPETDFYGVGVVLLRALGGDIAKKTFRPDIPKEIVEFCKRLPQYDLRERPNWEKENVIKTLSDIREAVFGRRHCGMLKKVKGGAG